MKANGLFWTSWAGVPGANWGRMRAISVVKGREPVAGEEYRPGMLELMDPGGRRAPMGGRTKVDRPPVKACFRVRAAEAVKKVGQERVRGSG